MGGTLQDVLHLIICLVIMTTGVVESACQTSCEVCNGDTCTRCSAGYYLSSSGVCGPCHSYCTACTGGGVYQCTACTDGNYLINANQCYPCSSRCAVTCTGATSNHCSACNSGSTLYLIGGSCYHCSNGCAVTCTGANSNQCSSSTCRDGYYLIGSTCYPCWATCAVPCTGANSNQCSTCKDGYYLGGSTCYPCYTGCATCTSTASNRCSTCKDGYYLSESRCYSCDTQCATCTGADWNQCSGCKDGYYLSDNSRNGTCIKICEDGWFGDRCDIECPPGCAVCNQDDGECTECNPGKHGVVCDHDCSHSCRSVNDSVTCAQIDGTCTHECVTGHWNNTCENLCNDGCLNSTCDTSTGHCLDGCLREYFGNACKSRCSYNCFEVEFVTDTNLCRRDGGACLGDCVAGYYGDTCGEACTSCTTCHREYGTCIQVSCPRRKYTRDGNVTVNFPATQIGSVGYSWERCIGGRGAYASAKCKGNYDAGAYWSPVTIAEGCNTTHDFQESINTKALKRLSELDINVTSIVDVLNNTIDLTLPWINLTAIDVIYAADILTIILDFDVVTLETLKLGLDLVNNLLQTGDDVITEAQLLGSAGNRIIRAIDELTYRLWSTGDPKVLIVRDYVAAQVIQQTDDGTTLTIGLQLEGSMIEKINKASLFSVELPMDVNVTLTDVAIYLPLDFVQGGSSKLTFHIYSKPDIFDTEGDRYVVNSHVAALRFTKGDKPVTDLGEDRVTAILFPLKDDKFLTCGYWDYEANENAGGWRTDGCTHPVSGDRIICECDHLTNFAILIDMDAHDISDTDKLVLGIITKVGLSLSIVGLGLTVLTFIVFRHLRHGRGQQVLINLSTAMLCSSILFLAGAERTDSYGGCIAVAVLLHYFILVSFMWMLVEGVLQYMRFVKVLGTYIPKFMLKTILPAWGVPLIPVIILLAYDYDLYYGGKGYCWLESDAMLYAFIIPVAVVIFANTIVFLMVMFNLCRRGKGLKPVNQSERKMAFLHFQAAISIFVVLGLTWVFGFFAIEDARIVFHYLFAIFNACQGLFIFLLFTAREKQIRTAWRKLCCKKSSFTSGSDSHAAKRAKLGTPSSSNTNSGSDSRSTGTTGYSTTSGGSRFDDIRLDNVPDNGSRNGSNMQFGNPEYIP